MTKIIGRVLTWAWLATAATTSPAVAGITGYLAFYPSKVDAIETEPV